MDNTRCMGRLASCSSKLGTLRFKPLPGWRDEAEENGLDRPLQEIVGTTNETCVDEEEYSIVYTFFRKTHT